MFIIVAQKRKDLAKKSVFCGKRNYTDRSNLFFKKFLCRAKTLKRFWLNYRKTKNEQKRKLKLLFKISKRNYPKLKPSSKNFLTLISVRSFPPRITRLEKKILSSKRSSLARKSEILNKKVCLGSNRLASSFYP